MNNTAIQHLRIRWMIRFDMAQVLQIESMSFLDDQWNEEDFAHQLRQRNSIGIVAEVDDVILGYLVYSLYHRRFEIEKMAVHPKSRRAKVGTALINKIKGKMGDQRRFVISTTFPAFNVIGNDFLRANGFYCKALSNDKQFVKLDFIGEELP